MTSTLLTLAVTLGIAGAGGIWALVHMVAKVVSRATRIEVHLEQLAPIPARVGALEQAVSGIQATCRAEHSRDDD